MPIIGMLFALQPWICKFMHALMSYVGGKTLL